MRFDGEHTEPVTLQLRSVTKNDHNEQVYTWSDYRKLYAEFYSRQGKQAASDGQILVVQDLRCRIRWISNLNERDYRIIRPKMGNEIYTITSIVQEGRRKYLLLMLERRDNE